MAKDNQTKKNSISKKLLYILLFAGIFILLCYGTGVVVRAAGFSKIENATPLSIEQLQSLDLLLRNKYPDEYQILQPLPYKLEKTALDLSAESAILVDASNGNVIYEKNADEIIPPASMTKLFAMYVLDEEISKGRFSYDDIIPIPREAWACNMPPHSSLMFLGKDQVVTLEELILGLSICSGNDAAYALAYTVCGSMEEFVARMNEVAEEIDLPHTHFVEASGYSENNLTTAREMAKFCTVYLQKHPDSLRRFHSVREFTYPKEHNMAPGDSYGPQDWSYGLPEHITMGITQKNTNPLLGKLPGCDGLKTGYIDESGYNLALTALRNDTRFLSITMKGAGKSTMEGQSNRVKDGTTLMDFAFDSFIDFYSTEFDKSYFVKIYGAKEKSAKFVPAFSVDSVCVPFITGNSLNECKNQVQIVVDVPQKIKGPVVQGEQYGSITVMLDGKKLQTIPLVADRSVEQAGVLTRIFDSVLY